MTAIEQRKQAEHALASIPAKNVMGKDVMRVIYREYRRTSSGTKICAVERVGAWERF